MDEERSSRSRWLGRPPERPGGRLVSLVPSLTLAVFELGAGARLVGRTRFCVEPRPGVDGVPVVGGTKNVHVEAVLALRPDMVLANREENVRGRVEAIARRVPVWLSDPRGPLDVPPLWRELGAICGTPEEAERRAEVLEAALAEAGARAPDAADARPTIGHPTVASPRPRFVYWVWRDPWMAAGHDTYISRLITAAGWRNALPPEMRRYPVLEPRSAEDLGADVMLFPDEPYAFSLPDDLDAFGSGSFEPASSEPASDVGAGPGAWRLPGRGLALGVSGRTFGWYPTHTLEGLRAGGRLRREVRG